MWVDTVTEKEDYISSWSQKWKFRAKIYLQGSMQITVSRWIRTFLTGWFLNFCKISTCAGFSALCTETKTLLKCCLNCAGFQKQAVSNWNDTEGATKWWKRSCWPRVPVILTKYVINPLSWRILVWTNSKRFTPASCWNQRNSPEVCKGGVVFKTDSARFSKHGYEWLASRDPHSRNVWIADDLSSSILIQSQLQSLSFGARILSKLQGYVPPKFWYGYGDLCVRFSCDEAQNTDGPTVQLTPRDDVVSTNVTNRQDLIDFTYATGGGISSIQNNIITGCQCDT